MLVEFELNGQKFSALNGGPEFTFNEAVSIVVPCADRAGSTTTGTTCCPGGGQATPAPDGAYHFVT
jgi:predicted 3-demethylubiquinone-9 3-methyltransferase (glyoxalase superfamily)